MGTTANRAYPYPDASDSVLPHEHIEALADAVDTDVEDLASPPLMRIVQTVAQTGLTDVTIFAATFTGADIHDPSGFHNPASNNSRAIPNKAGWYDVRGAIAFSAQTDYNSIEAFLRTNGTTNIEPANKNSPNTVSSPSVLPVSALISFNGSTDYVEICGRADRSGNGVSATVVSAQYACVLELRYIGPL